VECKRGEGGSTRTTGTLTILDYFMPKLVAAEKKYLNENGWGENGMGLGLPSLKNNTGFPYAYREINIGMRGEGASSYDVVVASWNRIEMEDGRMIDLVGIPFKADRPEFGSRRGESYVWHFAYDDEATMKQTRVWAESVGQNEEHIQDWLSRQRAEHIFSGFKTGSPRLTIWLFVNTENVEGMERFLGKQYQIERFGFENIEKLMKRLEGRVPEYSDMLGREMVYYGSRSDKPKPDPPEWFAKAMEGEIIPSARISCK